MNETMMEQSEDMLRIIQQLIQTNTWLESREFIQSHPELLADEAIFILEQLEQAAQESGDAHPASVFEDYLELLRLCREVGMQAAFADKIGGVHTEQPATLETILEEFSQEATSSKSVSRRIQLYQQALTLVSPKQNLLLWATLQSELGYNLFISSHGDIAQNLEQAIAAYREALRALNREATPLEWATTMNNLGNVYRSRVLGDRGENLEQAIVVYQEALTGSF